MPRKPKRSAEEKAKQYAESEASFQALLDGDPEALGLSNEKTRPGADGLLTDADSDSDQKGTPMIVPAHPPAPDKPRPEHSDFEKVPCGLFRALTTGDLDLYEFALACAIALALDWRRKELNTSLAGLKDLLDWPCQIEHLRRRLVELKSKGWFSFEEVRGQGSRYTIRLGETWERALREGADFDLSSVNSSGNPPHQRNSIPPGSHKTSV